MKIETKRQREARRKRHKRNTILTMAIALLVVVCLALVLWNGKKRLEVKNEESLAQIQELNQKIADENARTEQLDEYEKYVQTKKYVEEVAKNKFGMIYPDEMIFKATDK